MRVFHKGRLYRAIVSACLLAALITFSGCAAVNRRIAELADACRIHRDEAHDLAQIRNETRDELADQREELRRLAAQREIELARSEAERARLEMELCRANQEALQRQARGNIRDNVETKTVFNVSHSLELAGPIKINQEALKREQGRPQEALTAPPKKPCCSCCDAVCGCGSGHIRRHCPRCCQKPCEAEKNCGGPEALRRAEQEPLQRPPQVVRVPVDVPMMISLTLNNPSIEATRITHEPLVRDEPPVSCTCTAPSDCTTGMTDQDASPIPPIPQVEQQEGGGLMGTAPAATSATPPNTIVPLPRDSVVQPAPASPPNAAPSTSPPPPTAPTAPSGDTQPSGSAGLRPVPPPIVDGTAPQR